MDGRRDYGFDFMKSSHHEQRGSSGGSSSATPWLGGGGALGRSAFAFKEPEKKTNAERHADVVEYLKKRLQSGRGAATITEISDDTDLDLRRGKDDEVVTMLIANPKVEVLNEDDPLKEMSFTYMAKYAVSNKFELLQLINRCKGGICWEELQDTYANVGDDMLDMREAGRIIAVENKETHKLNLYPRGDVFLTELPGITRISPGAGIAATEKDMNEHIRRGEAVRLSGQWFRVSSETVGNQTLRSAAPLSVTMNADLKLRPTDTYAEDMGAPSGEAEAERVVTIGQAPKPTSQKAKAEAQYPLPLNGVFKDEAIFQGPAVRHGCSKALRELWFETRALVPADAAELHQVMFQKKLTTSKDAGAFKRPKKKVDDGSAKRERRRMKRLMKRQKTARTYKTVTNTHLENTLIGKLLEGAGETEGDRGGL